MYKALISTSTPSGYAIEIAAVHGQLAALARAILSFETLT